MRLQFPQLHERERNAQAITQLCAQHRRAPAGPFVLTVDGHGLWYGLRGVLGHDDSHHNLRDSVHQVKANITAADIMNVGMVQVYVHSGGANSNSMTFTIQ